MTMGKILQSCVTKALQLVVRFIREVQRHCNIFLSRPWITMRFAHIRAYTLHVPESLFELYLSIMIDVHLERVFKLFSWSKSPR